MEENKNATETNDQTIASGETVEVNTVTIDDLEAVNTTLEAEKARLIEERENYKVAYLKEKSKKRETYDDDGEDLSSEDRLRQITREELANSRLAEITREQDAIIKKALKENKELKLAQLNKTNTPPASIGTHSEGQQVQSTLVTPEQMNAFKSRGWSDKDIERYKKNLQKYGGR